MSIDDRTGLFVVFDDGALWWYHDVSEIALHAEADVERLRAWDATGRRITLARGDGRRIAVAETDVAASAKDELQALLIDRLRERNVAGVDRLSFEDLVDKASIRLVAVSLPSTKASLLSGLIEAVTAFLGRRP